MKYLSLPPSRTGITLVIMAIFTFISCQNEATKSADCDFRDSLGLTSSMSCGTIEVPEDHGESNGSKIQIAYVVIEAESASPESYPVIYFSGGPGGASLVPGRFDGWLESEMRKKHDIVLFDQRGINLSSGLPNIEAEIHRLMSGDLNNEEELEGMREVFQNFSKRMVEEGVNLASYNSYQNARDVGLLMDHLGYTKYNLFGGSYGTRLARIVQDMFPEKVNGVVLNSPNPLGGDFLVSRLQAYSLALERIFEYCTSQDSCRTKYPELQSVYFEAIASLEENPMSVDYTNGTFVVNPQDAIYIIRRALYRTSARSLIPELIYAFSDRSAAPVRDVIEGDVVLNENYNSSMWLSVERHEMYDPANTQEAIDSIYRTLPLLPNRLGLFTACYLAGEYLHNDVLSRSERSFAVSSLPTLIFVNHYDPVTPPEDGHLMQKGLTNSILFIMDEGGHGGGDQDCKSSVVTQFFEDVEADLDYSCLNLYSPALVNNP